MSKGSGDRTANRRSYDRNYRRYQLTTSDLLDDVQMALLGRNYNLDLEGYVAFMQEAGVAPREYEALAAHGPAAELRPVLFKMIKQLDKE